MKTLILGANGLIGQQFVKLCTAQDTPYVGTSYSRPGSGMLQFNQLDFERIPQLFDEVSPDVVINAIGLAGGVNFCQDNPETGRNYHVEATRIMVDWCMANDAAFAFVSTDYVFDGQNPPYKETDPTNPLNLYGHLKLEAEQLIQSHMEKYVIARTTNVFGWDPQTRTPNFLMHLLTSLQHQDSIKVPSFLYGTPTYVGDLAAGIWDLLKTKTYGLYHIVGPGYINRFDWAQKCLDMAGIEGKTLIEMDTPPQDMVPRPLLSHLDTTKFQAASTVKMKGVDEGLREFVNTMKVPPS